MTHSHRLLSFTPNFVSLSKSVLILMHGCDTFHLGGGHFDSSPTSFTKENRRSWKKYDHLDKAHWNDSGARGANKSKRAPIGMDSSLGHHLV